MGQLAQKSAADSGRTAGVCLETASPVAEPDEFSFLKGETLGQRAIRLDSELEGSRGDVGARGEGAHIEISASDSALGQRSAVMNIRENIAFEIIDSEELAKRWGVPETWVRDQVRRRALDPIPHVRLG